DVVIRLFTTPLDEPVVALTFAIDAAIRLHVAPPSRLTSMSTVLPEPRLCVQSIVWAEPTSQFTLVFGVVTVMAGLATVTSVVLEIGSATWRVTVGVALMRRCV